MKLFKKSIIKKTKKKSRGGMSGLAIRDNYTEESAFNFFIENSKLEYLSNGSNGVTFILTFNNSTMISPYKSTDIDTFYEPVNQILVKLILLTDDDEKVGDLAGIFYGKDKIHLTNKKEFDEEVELQKQIYFETMDYLEPICPAIIYSHVEKNTRAGWKNKSNIIDKLVNVLYDKKNLPVDPIAERWIDGGFKDIFEYDSIGIIGMEFAKDYKTLSDVYESSSEDYFILCCYMTMFLLLDLALKTGYSHADFHYGNLMINTSSHNYFSNYDNSPKDEIVGKPLLIDFGLSNKIPEETLNEIKNHVDRGEYTYALNQLCTVSRKDSEKLFDSPYHYGWACGYVDLTKDDDEQEKYVSSLMKKFENLTENKNKTEEEIEDEVYESMADMKNSQFPADANKILDELFKQRKKGIENTILNVNSHPEKYNNLKLPINKKQKYEIIDKQIITNSSKSKYSFPFKTQNQTRRQTQNQIQSQSQTPTQNQTRNRTRTLTNLRTKSNSQTRKRIKYF